MSAGRVSEPVGRPDRVYFWVAIAIFSIVAIAGFSAAIWKASAANGNYGYGWMGWGGGWGWWPRMRLIIIVPAVFVILFLFLIVRAAAPTPAVVLPERSSDPMQELRLRHARGEITSERYQRIAADLPVHS